MANWDLASVRVIDGDGQIMPSAVFLRFISSSDRSRPAPPYWGSEIVEQVRAAVRADKRVAELAARLRHLQSRRDELTSEIAKLKAAQAGLEKDSGVDIDEFLDSISDNSAELTGAESALSKVESLADSTRLELLGAIDAVESVVRAKLLQQLEAEHASIRAKLERDLTRQLDQLTHIRGARRPLSLSVRLTKPEELTAAKAA